MLVKVYSIAQESFNAIEIVLEINTFSQGLPYFDIVGLPSKAVEESKHRVRAAILNSGYIFPDKRIVVNLAPADVPKIGSFYDLPIAVGILGSILDIKLPEKALFYGELSLDGTVRYTKGVFLLALHAKEKGYRDIYVPFENAAQATDFTDLNVYAVRNLKELVDHFCGRTPLNIYSSDSSKSDDTFICEYRMEQVLGQTQAKRALEISAAGGHNLIMCGLPGSGKTMLAKAYRSILAPLTEKEAIEVTKIYSVSGDIPAGGTLLKQRPYRAPHHTISYAGMLGGNVDLKVGEITLAHRGVLFMDEFPEFPRYIIEALRQPMEDGYISIVRSRRSAVFPCSFTLLAAYNPCPCALPLDKCKCTPRQRERYLSKLSGPVLDRIDLFINVESIEVTKLSSELSNDLDGWTSSEMQVRVSHARSIQETRFKNTPICVNGEMNNTYINDFCALSSSSRQLLQRAISMFNLSTRSYFRILRVARTIADLADCLDIQEEHVAEAIQYKPNVKSD